MLRTIEVYVTSRVNAVAWHGTDLQEFHAEWNSQHRSALRRIADLLDSQQGVLEANAAAQDQVSSAGTAVVSGIVLGAAAVSASSGAAVCTTREDDVKRYEKAFDLLKLSDAAYGGADANLPGYRLLAGSELDALGLSGPKMWTASGLGVQVYEDRNGNYVVAYEGSQPPTLDVTKAYDMVADWIGNDLLGSNLPLLPGLNVQESQAISIAATLSKHVGSESVTYTGHSLGGQLAAVSAMMSGSQAVTFDATAVSDRAMSVLGGRERSEQYVTNYYAPNDLAHDVTGNAAGVNEEIGTGSWNPIASHNLGFIEDGLKDKLTSLGAGSYRPDGRVVSGYPGEPGWTDPAVG